MIRFSLFYHLLIHLFIFHLKTQSVLSIVNKRFEIIPSQTDTYPYCTSDLDCSKEQTLLFCLKNQCQCLNGGVTYENGQVYKYNMEWSPDRSKCISKPGSTCTLRNQWYSGETTKLDCSDGSECIPTSQVIASQNFGLGHSEASAGQRFPQSPYSKIDPRTPGDLRSFGICSGNQVLQYPHHHQHSGIEEYPNPDLIHRPPGNHPFANPGRNSASNLSKTGLISFVVVGTLAFIYF